MVSIKVKFRESTCDGREGRVYYQIIHERVVRQWNSDYRIFSDEWDPQRNVVVIKPESERRSFLLSIRQRIRWDLDRFNRVVQKFSCEQLPFTSDDIIEEFANSLEEQSFFNFMRDVITKLKERGKQRTSETYTTALNRFTKYRDGEDILLDAFDSDLMEGYEAHMAAQGLVPNTRSFHMRILRAVYRRAVEKGITEDRHPFRHVYTGVDKTAKRAIDLKTMKLIKEADLSGQPKAAYARDMFLLSFYLRGMSFVDMAYLRKGDLQGGYVTYRRRKTGQRLSIKWTKEMEGIVRKYPESETEFLLPIITSEGGMQTQYRSRQQGINAGLKKVAESVGLGMPLTLYCSRHSWASIARDRGIPISTIKDGLGHENELTTQIYLASLDTRAVDRANARIMAAL